MNSFRFRKAYYSAIILQIIITVYLLIANRSSKIKSKSANSYEYEQTSSGLNKNKFCESLLDYVNFQSTKNSITNLVNIIFRFFNRRNCFFLLEI